jgi:hypothetical protein
MITAAASDFLANTRLLGKSSLDGTLAVRFKTISRHREEPKV